MVQMGRLKDTAVSCFVLRVSGLKQTKNLCVLSVFSVRLKRYISALNCRRDFLVPRIIGRESNSVSILVGWVSFNHSTTQPFNNSTFISSLGVLQ